MCPWLPSRGPCLVQKDIVKNVYNSFERFWSFKKTNFFFSYCDKFTFTAETVRPTTSLTQKFLFTLGWTKMAWPRVEPVNLWSHHCQSFNYNWNDVCTLRIISILYYNIEQPIYPQQIHKCNRSLSLASNVDK